MRTHYLPISMAGAVLAVGTLAGVSVTLAPGVANATTVRIDCPRNQIRREIVTRLPSGWWQTPIVNSLTDVRVTTIGGRTALQCIYGPAGRIQRHAPANATCRASGQRFICETRTAGGGGGGGSSPTFSTGRLDIRQTYTADLDRGATGGTGRDVDLWFQAETRDLLSLVPRNGAKLGVGNRSNRGRDGCSRARLSNNRVSLRDVPVGSYVCAKTNEGRISQFRVNRLSGGSPKTLSIGYTTWR